MLSNGVEDRHIDALTKVYNKEYFLGKAEELFKSNPDIDFCIVELDVNRLTMINDMYGLGEGDRVLKTIASVLLETFEDVDQSLVCRMTADLFAFACPYDEKKVIGYIDRIEDKIRILSYDLSVDLLMSFGVYRVNDLDVPVSSMCERAKLASLV